MADIVERLRWCRWRNRETGVYTDSYEMTGIETERIEAAAEIERLREHLRMFQDDLERRLHQPSVPADKN